MYIETERKSLYFVNLLCIYVYLFNQSLSHITIFFLVYYYHYFIYMYKKSMVFRSYFGVCQFSFTHFFPVPAAPGFFTMSSFSLRRLNLLSLSRDSRWSWYVFIYFVLRSNFVHVFFTLSLFLGYNIVTLLNENKIYALDYTRCASFRPSLVILLLNFHFVFF